MNEVRATFSGEKEIKEEVDTTSNLQADWMDWNIDWIEQTGPLPWARLYILGSAFAVTRTRVQVLCAAWSK